MTSEILIMNREAIALAADSAASLNDSKIFNAHKIFTLSKYAPVGIMIYGNSSFMGIPWETIIKIYRKKLSKSRFNTLEEYVEDFIKFLITEPDLIPDEQQEIIFIFYLNGYFDFLSKRLKEQINAIIEKNKKTDEDEIIEIFSKIVDEDFKIWGESALYNGATQGDFLRFVECHKKLIEEKFVTYFEKFGSAIQGQHRCQKLLQKVIQISSNYFFKFSPKILPPNLSGLVIAGFGENEIFPSYSSFTIWMKYDNSLKYVKGNQGKIDFANPACISPFAQGEMVKLFMEGVDPNYQQVINQTMAELFQSYSEHCVEIQQPTEEKQKQELLMKLNQKNSLILSEFDKKLQSYRQKYHIDPIIQVVMNLPRDELSAMAESLINLTSFKRRVSMQAENVGGPIDVAVITKGDGFIWIKRKHYFKPELNPHFFANYYEGGAE